MPAACTHTALGSLILVTHRNSPSEGRQNSPDTTSKDSNELEETKQGDTHWPTLANFIFSLTNRLRLGAGAFGARTL